jgi:hypothetical protein
MKILYSILIFTICTIIGGVLDRVLDTSISKRFGIGLFGTIFFTIAFVAVMYLYKRPK